MLIVLPLYLSATTPNSTAGNEEALHKNEVLLTSSPIAIPAGGVIVTRN